ncbi:MAG: hypothetical protein ABIV50_09455 [Opitutus sp.]
MSSSCDGEERSDGAIPLKFQLDGHAGKPARNDKAERFISSGARQPAMPFHSNSASLLAELPSARRLYGGLPPIPAL